MRLYFVKEAMIGPCEASDEKFGTDLIELSGIDRVLTIGDVVDDVFAVC